ncbi:hypothetical protein [Ramlibacter tataouinensis]|uniref:Uncharacterized protein n=1 Tax=Ramlibacter tataouinensis (strain ATCC BAA-407 / DSM 14655 / LMG 21543 / TTB310) TaxID=365046 RepID=F5Y2D5_RAMTT|nr:hypothetical protein [Ramlibacter tataouinensis]AEG91109.1 Hypothetical protein Rta_00490 [Ramlibacter tataouinensis TTB310]
MSSQPEEHRSSASPHTPADETVEDGSTPPRVNRNGQGTDSIIAHLREQEEQRKPLSDQ